MMYYIGAAGMAFVFLLFAGVGAAVDYSYTWQYGNAVRENIPLAVALVEPTTAGMKGFIDNVRDVMLVRIIPLSRKAIKITQNYVSSICAIMRF